MEAISDFKTRFNQALSCRNMKPVELSEITGISKSTISHYMSGYTKPKTDKLYILAKALGVNEAWLIGYNIPMERDEEDQNVLRFEAELNHALDIIKDSEYSWNYSMAPDYDIIIKNNSDEIISCVHDYELVSVYESLRKKNILTIESLIANLEQFFLSADEKEHIKKYRFISKHSPESIDMIDIAIDKGCSIAEQISEQKKRIAELEATAQEFSEKLQPLRIYTYFGRIACAGSGFYFDDIPTETIEAPDMGGDFIIGVNGDSMEPDYHDGDLLYVAKTDHISHGDVGIFTIGNECFLKEYGENGLISRNRDYDDIPGTEDVRLIGKVIGKVTED